MRKPLMLEITKYDPKYYDKDGIYTKDEWTSYSDIGQVFDGQILKKDDYLFVENQYADAVLFFFQLHNCKKIKLVEKKVFVDSDELQDYETEIVLFFEKVKNKRKLELSQVKDYVKLLLRGDVDAKLECEANPQVYVMFGYDYYMFFYSPKITELMPIISKSSSLYTGLIY